MNFNVPNFSAVLNILIFKYFLLISIILFRDGLEVVFLTATFHQLRTLKTYVIEGEPMTISRAQIPTECMAAPEEYLMESHYAEKVLCFQI